MSDGRIQMEEFDFPYRWREAQNIQSSLVSAIQVEAQLRAVIRFFPASSGISQRVWFLGFLVYNPKGMIVRY